MNLDPDWKSRLGAFIDAKLAEPDPPWQHQKLYACRGCKDTGYTLGDTEHPMVPKMQVATAQFCDCAKGQAEEHGRMIYLERQKDKRQGRRHKSEPPEETPF